MSGSQGKKSTIITGIIVLIAIGGIAWFGYRAVKENLYPDRDNPYEVDISDFQADGAAALEYRETVTLSVPVTAPASLAIDQQGHLVIGGEDSIAVITPDGGFVRGYGTGGRVYALAVSGERVYAGVDDHIEVYETGGLYNRWESLGEKALVTSVAATGDRVCIADAGSKAIWIFTGEGRLLGRISGSPEFVIPSPYFDTAIDGEGNIWAANTGEHRLECFDGKGTLLLRWGSYSLKIEDFCGCCNPTHFTFLPDGRFVTAEKGIPRVKVLDPDGTLRDVVALANQFDEGTAGLDLAADREGRIYVLDPVREQVRIFERRAMQ
ncbi:hypothetical protein JXO52_12715 [bacterium]|nr:hypothetical protein [bacterium]